MSNETGAVEQAVTEALAGSGVQSSLTPQKTYVSLHVGPKGVTVDINGESGEDVIREFIEIAAFFDDGDDEPEEVCNNCSFQEGDLAEGYYLVKFKSESDPEIARYDGEVWWLFGFSKSQPEVFEVGERIL
jgi:hypothetical protein